MQPIIFYYLNHSIDSTRNKYYIDNSENLLLKNNNGEIISDTSNYKYKFIPIKSNKYFNNDKLNHDYNTTIDDHNNIDLENQIFRNDISSILIGKIQNNDNGQNFLSTNTLINYEINANLTIKYLNKTPNDVEINNYTFGLYPNIVLTPGNTIVNSIDELSIQNKFISLNNSIIVFDNSYNCSNISLSYIGTLGNQANPSNNFNNGFKFYISSNKDINYLQIDSFYCTIKQL